jgi:hypothetical protein
LPSMPVGQHNRSIIYERRSGFVASGIGAPVKL